MKQRDHHRLGKDATEEEQKLGRALNNIRNYLINPYEKLKTEEEREEYRKNHPELEEVKRIVEEIDENNVPVKLQQARKIKEWMEKNETTRPPRTQGKDLPEEEQKLGQALRTIRTRLIKPYIELKTEEEREEYRKKHPELEEVKRIVEEIDENNVPVMLQQARKIKEWMEKNETTIPPRTDGKNLPEEEQKLGKALSTIRIRLINPYEKLKTEEEREEYRKNHPELEEVKRIVKEIDRNNIPIYLQNARKIKEWMEENETTRPPRSGGKDLLEEEQKLGQALSTIRKELIKPYEKLKTEEEREEYINTLENRKNETITREQFMEIMEIVEKIDENNIPTYLQNARKIKEWMEKNETTIPPRRDGKNLPEEEQKLGSALNNIRFILINPYEKLKTEEEKEGYIYELEKRKKEPITREQFMEIMEIVEEIDGKRKNLTELVEKSKATQEKVAEAKKLENNFEQKLESNEQKGDSDIGDDSK